MSVSDEEKKVALEPQKSSIHLHSLMIGRQEYLKYVQQVKTVIEGDDGGLFQVP